MVKVSGFPELLTPPFSKFGVTVTVVTIGLFTVLVAINSILPEPELSNPVEISVLVHSKVFSPPEFELEKGIWTKSPSLYTRSSISLTCASGLIVILKLIGSPEQLKPFSSKLGITSIVAVTGMSQSFTAANSEIFSLPLLAIPISVLSFVH